MKGYDMKIILSTLIIFLLSGCAMMATKDYTTYVEAQKALSKDNTINESAKVAALIEMTKSADPAVRATGIMMLHQLQQNSKTIVVEPPKKNLLGL